MAWTGMRPLATSWPPDRRTATATGAAQRFSQTSTAADVPGSRAAAASSRSSSPSSPDDAPSNSANPSPPVQGPDLERDHRAVLVLGHEGDVEDADDAAIDEIEQQRRDLAVRLAPRPFEDDVVDGAHLLEIVERHSSSFTPLLRDGRSLSRHAPVG